MNDSQGCQSKIITQINLPLRAVMTRIVYWINNLIGVGIKPTHKGRVLCNIYLGSTHYVRLSWASLFTNLW